MGKPEGALGYIFVQRKFAFESILELLVTSTLIVPFWLVMNKAISQLHKIFSILIQRATWIEAILASKSQCDLVFMENRESFRILP
jgi:hypothetical protein